MIGAIIGDIVGSIYEFDQINTKAFEFFGPKCKFTDDSVCTVAVADMLLHDLPPAETMQKWCRRYPGRGYGGMFSHWIYDDPPEPYNSYGNGAAMRVSPAAYLHREDLDKALAASDRVTEITHNHPEGKKGARATTHAIWLAIQNEKPDVIREVITTEYGYDLTNSVDDIRPDYSFDVTCQETVPQAITCAIESISFEDAIRNAISIGGDADTLGAIAGPIAEAMYGVPDEMIEHVKKEYLAEADGILEIIREMYRVNDTPNDKRCFPKDYKSMSCPNCSQEWKLNSYSNKYTHRFCYVHVDNDYVNTQNYIIVEPDRTGCMRVHPIGDTHLSFVRMGYEPEILEPYWEYYKLDCGCDSVIPENLDEILKTWRQNRQNRG